MERRKISSRAGLNRALSALLVCIALMLNVSILDAQNSQVTVTGTVEDPFGPVIGASVVEKGVSGNGCITDIDGNFSLKVKSNATLVISFVGYKTVEVPTKGQKNIRVTLEEDSEMLDEVVVVGYGTMRKKDLTGSVVQINPSKIADANPTSVQDVLRGTPGLQIGYDASAKGSGASIQLRGKNSLGTDASPLIVLDGMAFYGELSEINPDDIGQIDVLKDASSAAIYGAKAAAGVIIITTKKGKQGKPVINVSANLAINNKSAYRDYYDANGYVRYRQDWYKMFNTYGKGSDGLYGYYRATDDKGVIAYPEGYYDDPRNMTTTEQNAWATNVGVAGLGPTEGESMMSLFARRLELNNSPLVFNNFICWQFL